MVIVAAVDDTEGDRRVVEEGAQLADAFNDELHVIHVGERKDLEKNTRSNHYNDRSKLEEIQDIAANIASTSTDEFVAVGQIGSPAKEVKKYTEEVNVRYLVIGGRKRSAVGKTIFGSVTQTILLNVDSAIVTVRT